MTRMAFITAGLAALLLPGLGLAEGRLEGEFSTRQADQADETNEACVAAEGPTLGAVGVVTGTSGGCTASILIGTQQPHKVNATALKGSKTNGSVKATQAATSFVQVEVSDTDGEEGEGVCDEAFGATNGGETEKCKVSGAIKGTAVSEGDDTTQSGRLSASCELGENGANLDTSEADGVQPPTADQFDVVVAAFAARKDVKIDSKGKLRVKHKGVPDTDTPSCE